MNENRKTKRHVVKVAATVLGWLLLTVGVACLILPGPGLLAIAAGLAVLSRHYTWASERLDPVKAAAFRAAEAAVKTRPKTVMAAASAIGVVALGLLWAFQPAVPAWWPLPVATWLPGGWAAGVGIVLSGVAAAAMLGYSAVHARRLGGRA